MRPSATPDPARGPAEGSDGLVVIEAIDVGEAWSKKRCASALFVHRMMQTAEAGP